MLEEEVDVIDGVDDEEEQPKKKKKRRAAEPDDSDEVAADAAYLTECASVDRDDISEEFVKLPGQLAYWNARYAEALDAFLVAEANVKLIRGQRTPIVREIVKETATGRATEAMFEAAVEEDEEVQEAVRRRIKAEVKKARMFGALDTMRAKKEVLISLGAHIRAEMGGDPLIRDEQRTISERRRDRNSD